MPEVEEALGDWQAAEVVEGRARREPEVEETLGVWRVDEEVEAGAEDEGEAERVPAREGSALATGDEEDEEEEGGGEGNAESMVRGPWPMAVATTCWYKV